MTTHNRLQGTPLEELESKRKQIAQAITVLQDALREIEAELERRRLSPS